MYGTKENKLIIKLIKIELKRHDVSKVEIKSLDLKSYSYDVLVKGFVFMTSALGLNHAFGMKKVERDDTIGIISALENELQKAVHGGFGKTA